MSGCAGTVETPSQRLRDALSAGEVFKDPPGRIASIIRIRSSKGNPLTVGRPCRMDATPGGPLDERVVLPGTPAIRKGDLIPSDAPGFGIEVTKDWLESKAV